MSAISQAVRDLASKIKPSWVKGKWQEAAISARHRAKIRRQTLLAGEEWPYDPPRKEMKTKLKGHKHDKEAAERRKKIEELMGRMPTILQEWKKRKQTAKEKGTST